MNLENGIVIQVIYGLPPFPGVTSVPLRGDSRFDCAYVSADMVALKPSQRAFINVTLRCMKIFH